MPSNPELDGLDGGTGFGGQSDYIESNVYESRKITQVN